MLHIYCYWTWLSVVVHTWPASATPPPTRVSRQRPAAKVSLKLRLLYLSAAACATGRRKKCSREKRNCRDIAQRRCSEPNGSAYRCNETIAQSAMATLPRLHYVEQTWTLVGTASPQNGIRQIFMKLIHSTTYISRPYYCVRFGNTPFLFFNEILKIKIKVQCGCSDFEGFVVEMKQGCVARQKLNRNY